MSNNNGEQTDVEEEEKTEWKCKVLSGLNFLGEGVWTLMTIAKIFFKKKINK